jgi:hypothetical protein
VASLLGANVLHLAALPEHLGEWMWAGIFFAVVAAAEWMAAWALITRPDARRARLAVVLSLATVAVWAVSRTVGLPFGPDRGQPEAIGWADAICTGLELITAATACRLAGASAPAGHRTDRRLAIGVVTAGIAAITVVGVLAPEAPHHRPMPTAESAGRTSA